MWKQSSGYRDIHPAVRMETRVHYMHTSISRVICIEHTLILQYCTSLRSITVHTTRFWIMVQQEIYVRVQFTLTLQTVLRVILPQGQYYQGYSRSPGDALVGPDSRTTLGLKRFNIKRSHVNLTSEQMTSCWALSLLCGS